MMKTHKRCAKCQETKECSEFGKNRHQWDGLQTYCKVCTASNKRESKRHKEYNREYMIQYRKDQKIKLAPLKEQRRIERQKKLEEYRAIKQEENLKIAEERNKIREAKRTARKESQKVRFAEFLKNFRPAERNKKKTREWNRARMKVRRATQRTNGGKITKRQWEIICDYFDNKCVCCGNPEEKYKDLSIDHVVPVIKGGTSDWTNLQPLCFSCNSKKHASTIDYRPPNSIQELEELLSKNKRAEPKKRANRTQERSDTSRGLGSENE